MTSPAEPPFTSDLENGTRHVRQVNVGDLKYWAVCEWQGVQHPDAPGDRYCVAFPMTPGEFEPFVCESFSVSDAQLKIRAANDLYWREKD